MSIFTAFLVPFVRISSNQNSYPLASAFYPMVYGARLVPEPENAATLPSVNIHNAHSMAAGMHYPGRIEIMVIPSMLDCLLLLLLGSVLYTELPQQYDMRSRR